MSVVKEFKQFISRGNVLDLAVGIVIGAGFGSVVSSLVADIIMPPLGVLIGGVDFTDLQLILRKGYVDSAGLSVPAVAIRYGKFLQTLFDFLIIAFAVFLVVKVVNRIRTRQEKAVEPIQPLVKEEVRLLTEIRDLLKK